MPSKKLSLHEGSPPVETLNLASLKATQTTYIKDINQPNLPILSSAQKYIMNAGATPKLITSVNESNSFPTFDVALINLAILPSKPSMIAAIKTAITDNSNLPSNANLIEVKPIHTPTSVIIFGKITLEFLFDTNFIFFFGFSIYLLAINVSPATAL